MRRIPVFATAALVACLMIPATGEAGASRSSGPARFAGFERMQSLYLRLHARAVWLGAHPRPAVPRPRAPQSPAGPSVPGAWSTVKHAQKVSRDLLPPPPPGSEADTEQEPDIAVDPNDPSVVVAAFQEGRFPDIAAADDGYATSHDGGKTWITNPLPYLTQSVGGPYERASDPVVAFGPDGSVYISTIALNQQQDFRTAVTVQRSDDGGLTFKKPSIVKLDTDPAVFNDKEWIGVDTSPTSPHFGRIYVVWDRINGSFEPPVLRYSDDRGNSWSTLITLSNVDALGTIPMIRPDGSLTVEYLDVDSFDIVAQTSTNGGKTFGPVVTIEHCGATDPPDQRDGGCIPSATVDPVTGSLYVAWTDARFRNDGLDDVVVSRSEDGGATWSAPLVVNPDGSGSGIEHMTAAVGALDHVVHVTYYTRKKVNGQFGRIVRERYSVSADDGFDFGGELIIGPRIDLKWAARAGGLYFLGDYAGVAAAPSAAHPVWCRASRPAQEETYHQTTWSAIVV
jgi:hypothetical protein